MKNNRRHLEIRSEHARFVFSLESVLEVNLPGISARFLLQSFSRRSGFSYDAAFHPAVRNLMTRERNGKNKKRRANGRADKRCLIQSIQAETNEN